MIQAIKQWAKKIRYAAKVLIWLADCLAGFPVPDFQEDKSEQPGNQGFQKDAAKDTIRDEVL